jgi:hypothetical protein
MSLTVCAANEGRANSVASVFDGRAARRPTEYVDEIISQKPINQLINEDLLAIFNDNYVDEIKHCNGSDQYICPIYLIPFDYDIFFGIYNPNDFPVAIHSCIGGMRFRKNIIIEPNSYSSLTDDYPMLLNHTRVPFYDNLFQILNLSESEIIPLHIRYGNFHHDFPKWTCILYGFGAVVGGKDLINNMHYNGISAHRIDTIAIEQQNHELHELIGTNLKLRFNLTTDSVFIKKVELCGYVLK